MNERMTEWPNGWIKGWLDKWIKWMIYKLINKWMTLNNIYKLSKTRQTKPQQIHIKNKFKTCRNHPRKHHFQKHFFPTWDSSPWKQAMVIKRTYTLKQQAHQTCHWQLWMSTQCFVHKTPRNPKADNQTSNRKQRERPVTKLILHSQINYAKRSLKTHHRDWGWFLLGFHCFMSLSLFTWGVREGWGQFLPLLYIQVTRSLTDLLD